MTTAEALERCRRCGRNKDLITGDGVTVCAGCVRSLGELAADPDNVNDAVLAEMMKRHGDVVQLIRDKSGKLSWDWIGWP